MGVKGLKSFPTDGTSGDAWQTDVLATSPESVLVVDQNGNVVDANPSACDLLRISLLALLGEPVQRFLPGLVVDREKRLTPNGLSERSRDVYRDMIARTLDGRPVALEASVFDIPGASPRRIALICRDVSKRRQLERDLHKLAYYDTSTELPNRAYLLQMLDGLLRHPDAVPLGLSVIAISLGRLEFFAGTLGETTRVTMLKDAAARLKAQPIVQEVVQLDESTLGAVVSIIDGEDGVPAMVHRLHAAVEIGYMSHATSARVVPHFGVAMFPDDCAEALEAVRRARFALTLAMKRSAGRFEVYRREHFHNAVKNLVMERELRRALQSEPQQFEFDYQPKVCPCTHTLLGFEALVRWNNPKQGRVPPDKFLALVRETGLITKLTDIALRNVAQRLSEWGSSGFDLVPVAVNISADDILNGDLVARVSRILTEFDIPAGLLECEITEDEAVAEMEAARAVLAGLDKLGIRTTIDDFGTGYSSLRYLAELPVDSIKIDRMFIRDVTTDPTKQALVRAIIAMGRALGSDVVAEGIEEADQLSLVTELGCQAVQGHYFDRPLVPNAATERLKDHSAGRSLYPTIDPACIPTGD